MRIIHHWKVGIFRWVLASFCASELTAKEAPSTATDVRTHQTLEEFATNPHHVYRLWSLIYHERYFRKMRNTVFSEENTYSNFVGWPAPGRLDWTDFQIRQEKRKRVSLLRRRIEEARKGPSLPPVVLEFRSPLGRYDFEREVFPLMSRAREVNDVWMTALRLPVPEELAYPDLEMPPPPGYYPDAGRRDDAANLKARIIDVAPMHGGKPSFPTRLPLSPARAEQVEADAKLARHDPEVLVCLYGHFEENDLSDAFVRFHFGRLTILDPHSREVLYETTPSR